MQRRKSFLAALVLMSMAGMLGLSAVPAAFAERETAERAAHAHTAARAADRARRALAGHKVARAVAAAEKAVAAQPGSSAYRALLGEAYLAAGRLNSARTAFADAVSLQPENDGAAFKLALMLISHGEMVAARDLIEVRQSTLSVEDYALAKALWGEAETAAAPLEAAMRAGEANARTRQNLAFIYALSGRWVHARTIASMDLPPDQVSDRIGQWAQLARTGADRDRVAMLLGVMPRQDPGVPKALARAATLPPSHPKTAQATTLLAAAPSHLPDQEADPAPPPSVEAMYEVDPAIKDPAPVRLEHFLNMRQAKPKHSVPDSIAPRVRRERAELWRPVLRPGRAFVVQLGAFKSAAGAASAWRKIARRHPGLSNLDGRQAQVTLPNGTFYRLSVAMPSRGRAESLCGAVKAQGSACFVRSLASGDLIRWASPMRRGLPKLASRDALRSKSGRGRP